MSLGKWIKGKWIKGKWIKGKWNGGIQGVNNMSLLNKPIEGGCGCGHVRYTITTAPLIVHCCHCRYCQRQTGSAFVINALYEAPEIEVTNGVVYKIVTPSPSGKGQIIARCPKCQVALWSHYNMGGLREKISFLRVGTLDNPDLIPPDIHIFTESKQPWFEIPKNATSVEAFYEMEDILTKENYKRLSSLWDEIGTPE
jgi:hypothetical protein